MYKKLSLIFTLIFVQTMNGSESKTPKIKAKTEFSSTFLSDGTFHKKIKTSLTDTSTQLHYSFIWDPKNQSKVSPKIDYENEKKEPNLANIKDTLFTTQLRHVWIAGTLRLPPGTTLLETTEGKFSIS